MELTVHCPACGGRTTAEPRDADSQGFILCPYCQSEIPLQRGAEGEPPDSADTGGLAA